MSNFLRGYWIIWILVSFSVGLAIFGENYGSIIVWVTLGLIWTIERSSVRMWRRAYLDEINVTEAELTANRKRNK